MTRMSLVCPSSLRMTDSRLRIVSSRIAIRLFVVALAVISGHQSVQADSPESQVKQPVVVDEAAAPLAPTQGAEQAQSLTPIRRATDPHADPGDRARKSSLTSSLALLGLVLGGAYITLNMLRRRQNDRSAQTQAIDLLASRRLDGQSTLHLVRIGRRVLAVGSSSGGTRTLAVIDDPEEIAQLISASSESGMGHAPAGWRPFQRRNSPANEDTGAGSLPNPSTVILGGPGRPA
jgi:flagellar biogenesis protein FliO